MNQLITAFTEGVIAFTATNIDDLVILLLFFAQVNSKFRYRHIVIGKYLGFVAIILASLPGFFGGLVVQRELIGLLGILPIAIGIKELLNRQTNETDIQTVTTDFKQSSHPNPVLSFLLSILHPPTYQVAAVTLANGGDNISIYIPLFAGHNLASLVVILVVFLLMVGVWCAITYLLTRQATIAYVLSRYGKKIVPFVLISLGLFILYERGTLNLLPFFKNN
jgi:cadmium resistance transport/sequestration family protein